MTPGGHSLVKRAPFPYLPDMTLRPILIHPDPRLRRTADPVGVIDDAVRNLVSDMFDTMYDAPGIGLAATQLGVMKQVFVMDCGGKDDPPAPLALINPELLWVSEDKALSEEGCLSIPDVFENVTRPARVALAWTDLDGARRQSDFDGRWATCAQHELDHLQGKLFIDYLGSVKRTLITARMKKLKREKARA